MSGTLLGRLPLNTQTIGDTLPKVLVEKKALTERLAKVRFNTLC